MTTKHPVLDTDLHFIVNPSNRSIIKQYEGKAHVMQYDQNSERLTFDVPRHIEEHDMSLCDVIQVHYENISNGTSSSTRQTYRGVEVIDQESVEVGEETISFSWLIPRNATTFAGLLKFQLRFVCHDPEYPTVVVYRWHTNVNSDISIVSGLAYTEEELPPSVTATLQSLEIEEVYDEDGIQEGVNIILDGVYHTIYHGGYAPKALDMVELNENKTQTIDENSTHTQYPTAAAVHLLTEDINDKFDGEVESLQDTVNEHATTIENNTKAIGDNSEAIENNATAIESIVNGTTPAGFARGFHYTVKAEGPWASKDTTNIADHLIYETNFIKANTRYLLDFDGQLIEAYSNSNGTKILGSRLDLKDCPGSVYSDTTLATYITIVWLEAGVQSIYGFVSGTVNVKTAGMYYYVNIVSPDTMSKLAFSILAGKTLTRIIECETISI